MRSPFDDLGKTREPEPQGEEVGGTFSCQEDNCLHIVRTARYLTAHKLVTWQCPDGHLSKATMNLD
jgi:hypothetical protein